MNKETKKWVKENNASIPTKGSPSGNDVRQQLRLLQFVDQDGQRQTDQKRDQADQQAQDAGGVFSVKDVHFDPPIHYSRENVKFLNGFIGNSLKHALKRDGYVKMIIVGWWK